MLSSRRSRRLATRVVWDTPVVTARVPKGYACRRRPSLCDYGKSAKSGVGRGITETFRALSWSPWAGRAPRKCIGHHTHRSGARTTLGLRGSFVLLGLGLANLSPVMGSVPLSVVGRRGRAPRRSLRGPRAVIAGESFGGGTPRPALSGPAHVALVSLRRANC